MSDQRDMIDAVALTGVNFQSAAPVFTKMLQKCGKHMDGDDFASITERLTKYYGKDNADLHKWVLDTSMELLERKTDDE